MTEYEYDFESSKASEPYLGTVNAAEERYGLPKNMLANLIQAESSFNPDALGPETKYGKAKGITQIIPQFHPDVDPYDPEASIDYAAEKLSEYYEEFGDWDSAIASWNAGPTNVRKHGLKKLRGMKAFTETDNYLKTINASRRAINNPLLPDIPADDPNADVDEWGGIPIEEGDEYGGQSVETVETDEYGGQVYNPKDLKWEKPFPLGRRLIDNWVRPVLEGFGSAAGAIIGGGGGATGGTLLGPGGTIAGGAAGGVAGGALGYSMADRFTDMLQEWLGYYEPMPVMLHMQKAGEAAVEGATYEMGGMAAGPMLKGAGRGAAWAKSKIYPSDRQAKQAAGKVLAAFTNKGPIIVENMEQAKALEEMIPGLKFDLGQATGDQGALKYIIEGVDDSVELAAKRAEREAANMKAITDFIKKQKGPRGAEDVMRPLRAVRAMMDEAESLAASNLERQQTALQGKIDPMEIGSTVRSEMEAGEKAARTKAEELFAAVPDQEMLADDLITGFEKILKPGRFEGKDKFPKVLRDALEELKKGKAPKAKAPEPDVDIPMKGEAVTSHAYRIARSGKYSASEARAKADIFYRQSEKLTKEGKVQEAMDVGTQGQKWREVAEALEGQPQHKGWDEETAEEIIEKAGPKTITLAEIQQLRSEILEDLRTAKDKGLPRSLRKRLTQAVDVIDKKLMGETTEEGEVVYHIAKRPYKGGKPNKDAYFAGTRQDGTYTGADFVEEFAGSPEHGYGTQVHSIRIPKDAKILDLKSGSKDAKEFMRQANMLDDPMGGDWTNPDKISKLTRDMGYDGVRESEELFLTKELIDRSKAGKIQDFEKGFTPVTKAPSEQLRKAQQYFRTEVVEKYGKGSVGRVLRGEETVSDAMVADAFFQKRGKGEQAAVEFMKIMGDNNKARSAMREHINQKLYDLRNNRTGEITTASLKGFLKDYRLAINKLGLGGEYNTLIKARLAADKALAASKEFQKSAASRVLKADVNDMVKQAFAVGGSKKDAAEGLMSQLDEAMKGFHPDDQKRAVRGLQNAMIDEILTDIPLEGTSRDLLSSTAMASQFRKYDAALKVIFRDNPEKLKAMQAVRKAVKALEYHTGEKIEGGEKYAADVFRRIAFLQGHTAVAAVDISRKAVRKLRGLGKKKIRRYINRGILDPNTAYELMQVGKGGRAEKIESGVARSLVRLGLIAPQRKEDERKKR
jgi:hypothetical protein